MFLITASGTEVWGGIDDPFRLDHSGISAEKCLGFHECKTDYPRRKFFNFCQTAAGEDHELFAVDPPVGTAFGIQPGNIAGNTGKQSFTMQKDGNAFYFVDNDGKRYKIAITSVN